MSDSESEASENELFGSKSQPTETTMDPFAFAKKQQSARYGSFASMQLSPGLMAAIKHKGYGNPTPIQRKVIPIVLSGSDVIAMARTGSGKTLAFSIPLLQQLQSHSTSAGIRALVLAPTRELCMQTYKYLKSLSSGSDLRIALLTGGDNLEHHFEVLAANPDVVVASPGRLLHILHETGLSLARLEMLVFDEADRLLEMGFQAEIEAIVKECPASRQTLLFSATLPKLLVEFSRVGLRNPEMVRLDADSQLSENLYVGYISTRAEDKPVTLLLTVKTLLKSGQQAIIFTCSRSHVDFLSELLAGIGYSVSSIYGQMDSSARKINLAKFVKKKCQILVVTDVAARGIDIPQLELVINYDFPDKPKLFIHRVGRTARAGHSGSAFSLLQPDELAYLLDLNLFLNSSNVKSTLNGKRNCVHGRIPSAILASEIEGFQQTLKGDPQLEKMAKSVSNATKLYRDTRKAPSRASILRAKELIEDGGLLSLEIHPDFAHLESAGESRLEEFMRTQMKDFRPAQTIFEISHLKNGKGKANPKSEMMSRTRQANDYFIAKAQKIKDKRRSEQMEIDGIGREQASSSTQTSKNGMEVPEEDDVVNSDSENDNEIVSKKRKREESDSMDDEDEENGDETENSKTPKPSTKPNKYALKPKKKQKIQESWRDDKYFMSTTPTTTTATDAGLSIREGGPKSIEDMILDLNPDDDRSIFRKKTMLAWDKKKKNYVNQEDTEAGKKKMKLRNEAGQVVIVGAKNRGKLYQDWSERTHKSIPRVGEQNEEAMPETSFWRHSKHLKKSAAPTTRIGKHGGVTHGSISEIKTKEQLIKSKTEKEKQEARKRFLAKKTGGGGGKFKGGRR